MMRYVILPQIPAEKTVPLKLDRSSHDENTEEKVIIPQIIPIEKTSLLKLGRITRDKSGILFFLHIHKGGGTTINHLFRKYRRYPHNINGNPWRVENSSSRQLIKFWDYGKNQFEEFLKILNQKKVKFVAFEWNYFKHAEEIDTTRIRLVTCIRDPYSRFVSSMFAHGASKRELLNPVSWMNRDFQWARVKSQHFWVNWNKPNFYVRMMNGYGDEPRREVTREDLGTAKRNLAEFDVVMILEIAESFRLLEKYGIKYQGEAFNVNHHKRNVGMTREQFIELNKLDYEFYEYATNFSLSMLDDLTK